jgi:glycosyltransferase involved in cell wall biosynthesis
MDNRESELNKVLFLSYDGLTDPLGQSQILPYLCGLSFKEYTITIVSFEKEDRFAKESGRIFELCEKHSLSWRPLKYHSYPPVLSTLYDLFQLRKLAIRLHRQKQFGIVHCRSYITSLVGLMMKKRFGIKFVFDMRGFWADERVEGGLWNLNNPVFNLVYNYFKKKEKRFLTESDYVISLTENAKKEILSWKIASAPISIISTCVDLELFDPERVKPDDQARLREQLGIKADEFVLLYLGSWGTWYLIDEMLAFFSVLKKEVKKAKFLIVSPDRVELANYLDKNDVILTQTARQLVPLYISLANASVFFIKPTFSKKASSATKMGEIVAMNVPFIVNKGWGDVESIVNMGASGYYLNDFTDQSFRDSIVWLSGGGFEKNRPLATKLFGLTAGIDRYLGVYRDLIRF